jgi:D-alanyl-lipoteichoic acid acyltransferase DltB (MBOAT superfamily)
VNLGILGFFKYFNFFIDSFQTMINGLGGNVDSLHLNIILPVGISFYTFQTLSYTFDVYRKKLEPTNNIIDFALFVSFFPQLVAGPIERAKDLLPQLYNKLSPTKDQLKEGATLIVLGLFRKVMIGDTAGRIVDHIFGNLHLYKSIEIIAAVLLFGIQIYADFSGYSKIARGTAKLLGIELMVNFEQPYLSRNITEFWRRWHISLSSWLKDYLYITLGGNRKGQARTYINLMITMLLGGLWHGASWNFVIWGGLHGFYLAAHKFFSKGKTEYDPITRLKDIPKVMLTFVLVAFTWLFFRATSWESTQQIFYAIFDWQASEYAHIFTQILLSYFVLTFALDIVENRFGHTFVLRFKSISIRLGILISLFVVTLIYIFQSKPLPFIYFQF